MFTELDISEKRIYQIKETFLKKQTYKKTKHVDFLYNKKIMKIVFFMVLVGIS
jgi:hypothetical protein